MKRKILGVFLFILTIFCTFIGITNVKADSYNGKIMDGKWIAGYYFKKHDDKLIHYHQARFINRSDGAFVYCIQPFVLVKPNATYEVTARDFIQIAKMTPEQWDRVSKLAYYGYQYNENGYNHNEDKWYAATQMLIWKTVAPNNLMYFTNKLNGTRNDNVLVNEMNEINTLVANHYKKPSIDLPKEGEIGKEIVGTDKNGILNNFKVSKVIGGTVSKNGNNIYINPTEVGNMEITLSKTSEKYNEPIYLYYATDSQNVMRRGNLDPLQLKLNIKIVGGKVSVDKDDKESSTAQGEATLKGAIYGVYNNKGQLIEKLETDAEGKVTSNYLPSLGKYYIQEIKAPEGYNLDQSKYPFEITNNNLNPIVKVFDNVIKNEFNFTKVFAQNITGSMKPEPNADFGIYDSNNKLLFKVTSDKNGNFSFELPYGNYVMKQLTTSSGTEKIKDMKFEVKEDGKIISKVLANAQISAKLKVIKVDKETNKIVKRAGIKFKIKNTKTNDYVCQTVTYPSKKTICEYETNTNGEFITPYPLLTGTYKLEEVDQKIDGYLWNKESIEFTIDENSKFVDDNQYGIIFETKFSNKSVKGQIIIHKLGENFTFNNSKFSYESMNLPDVKYEIRANENILLNGDILFKKGELVEYVYTNSKGIAVSSLLPLGKYNVKEVKSSLNHMVDSKEYLVDLKYADQYTEIVLSKNEYKNYLPKGKLIINKKDSIDQTLIANTEFKLYKEPVRIERNISKYGELIYIGKTNEKGQLIIDILPAGKYTLIESKPAPGYKPNNTIITFEIKEDGEIITKDITNDHFKGTLEFTKTDISESEPLPNTKIEIYNIEDKLIFSGKTDENGQIVIKNIKYGKYYIIEKEAPEGYTINPEKMYFEIKEDGEVVKATMKDKMIEGTLEFTKTDVSESKTLPNTVIEIYNEKDELIFKGKTDENGQIVIKNIKYGKYYIVEKEAPEGYTINPEKMYFEIKEDGEIIKATMKDEKIIEVPDTEKNKFPYFELGSLLVSAVGLGMIVYAKRKKK